MTFSWSNLLRIYFVLKCLSQDTLKKFTSMKNCFFVNEWMVFSSKAFSLVLLSQKFKADDLILNIKTSVTVFQYIPYIIWRSIFSRNVPISLEAKLRDVFISERKLTVARIFTVFHLVGLISVTSKYPGKVMYRNVGCDSQHYGTDEKPSATVAWSVLEVTPI